MNGLPQYNNRATQILNCNEKRRYVSQASCEQVIFNLTHDRSIKRPGPLYSYNCPICNGWHMTSSTPR